MNQRKLTRKEKAEAQRKAPAGASVSKKVKAPGNKISLPVLIIALVGILFYVNSLQNEFAYDDYSAIKKNWVVKQGTSSFPTILTTSYRYGYWEGDDELYRPLPLMVFATVWQFFPDNPFPFHLLNVLLYALTGIVLFKLLRKLLPQINPLLPFAASVLFIAHPLHTEVVANIKSMDELLSFLFVLLTIDRLLLYVNTSSLKNLIVAWIFFLLAFMSKEATITMLAAIPLALAMFTKAPRGKIIQVTLVLSTAALLFIVLRAQALGSFSAGKNFQFIENVLVKAPDAATRLATVFLILFHYIKLMVVPYPLSSDYSYKQIDLTHWASPLPWLSVIFYLAIAFVAVRYYKSNKIVSFAILFFLVTLSIYSNLVITIGSSIAERFLYVPLLGFAIAVSWLLLKIFKVPFAIETKNDDDKVFQKENRNVIIVLAVLLVPYSIITVSRNTDWKNSHSLFSKDVITSSKSALIHYNYANDLKTEQALTTDDAALKNNFLDSSIAQYKRAIELYPRYAEAYEQLGLAYYYKGADKEAFESVKRAIELDPLKATAYNSLGSIYFDRAKDYQKALELFQRAVQLYPSYIDGWRNLGCAYGTLRQPDKALEAFQRALKYDPINADVLAFIGQVYQGQSDEATANSYFQRAEEIRKNKK